MSTESAKRALMHSALLLRVCSALENLGYNRDFSGEINNSGSGSKINMKAEVTLTRVELMSGTQQW